eukprot:4385581-Pyramimonas_sp.AAC.1
MCFAGGAEQVVDRFKRQVSAMRVHQNGMSRVAHDLGQLCKLCFIALCMLIGCTSATSVDAAPSINPFQDGLDPSEVRSKPNPNQYFAVIVALGF